MADNRAWGTAARGKCLCRRQLLHADPGVRERFGRTVPLEVWFVPVKAHSLPVLLDPNSIRSREGAR
jgi:hypothetical protein